uniref:Uncharacterized protein n=1 Tax=Cucumis melo TaxID=3656 RepID=A0A9I9DIU0_CUCME
KGYFENTQSRVLALDLSSQPRSKSRFSLVHFIFRNQEDQPSESIISSHNQWLQLVLGLLSGHSPVRHAVLLLTSVLNPSPHQPPPFAWQLTNPSLIVLSGVRL